MQEDAAGRLDAPAGPQEAGVGKYQLGREHILAQQALRPIEIGQDGVEQRGALDDGGFDVFPLGRIDHERNRIERPGAIGAFRIAIDVVGDAVVVDQAAALRASGELRPLMAHRGRAIPTAPPMRAKLCVPEPSTSS